MAEEIEQLNEAAERAIEKCCIAYAVYLAPSAKKFEVVSDVLEDVRSYLVPAGNWNGVVGQMFTARFFEVVGQVVPGFLPTATSSEDDV